jgi:hypothetical protein
MTPTVIILLGALYIISGVLTFGMVFAHFQRKFPTIAKRHIAEDRRLALLGALIPFSLLVALIITDAARHGLKYRSEGR